MTDTLSPLSMGFFKYDLFPYIVCHLITGWTKTGDPMTGELGKNVCFRRSALITALELPQGGLAKQMIEQIKAEDREKQTQLREELLERVFSKYPTLRQKKD